MRNNRYATNEFDPELDEFEYGNTSEYTGEPELESPFDEAQEMELAADLLEVMDEAALDQFLGNLMRRASQATGSLLQTSTGRALGGILKGAARKALPHLGRAIGTYISGSNGGDIGARLASQAGRAFGLELEGLSPEDQEYELARRYVRFAGSAAQRAATMNSASPQRAARNATAAAARQHAPGLLRKTQDLAPSSGRRDSGRWLRRGRTVIIVNA